jgi:hypothetical protein
MGDIDRGYRSGPDLAVHLSQEQFAVGPIQTLARLVKNQQSRILNQGTGQQNHSLKTGREGKERFVGEIQQLKLP